MLQEIENLIIQALKQFMTKPELQVAELHALYTIYRDLKGITDGKIESGNA